MLFENLTIQQGLRRIVAQFTADAGLREDLMQEALIHLWRLEEESPGQARCWYLQGCRFHLQNCVRRGRSVDSQKRAWARQPDPDTPSDGDSQWEWPDSTASFWDEVSARDIIAALVLRLTDTEREALLCLADGLSAREIADRMNRSHTLVNRWRRRIALVATQLGLGAETPARDRPTALSA